MEWTERAPAKINLALDVLAQREDGYHELEMVMCSVDLSDHLSFTPIEENRIEVYSNKAFLPVDRRNHVYQAIQLLKSQFSISSGMIVEIDKVIPVAAGLGGGSTDAAATIRAINQLWKLQLTQEQMIEIGMRIGTDVPYSICGGTAFVTGRGENVESIRSLPSCWVVLAKPKVSVSTKSVFKSLPADEVPNLDRSARAVKEAIEKGDYKEMVANMNNALELVTFQRHPELARIKERMVRFGLDGATMSGSGPTIIGFTQQLNRANRTYNSLRGFCDEVYICRTLG